MPTRLNPVPAAPARDRWPVWWQWTTVASVTTVLAGALTRCQPAVWAAGTVLGAAALIAGVWMWRGEQSPRCCVCGAPDVSYENYRGQPFCWPCADCPCGETPCVRTGINDPAVSASTAEGSDR